MPRKSPAGQRCRTATGGPALNHYPSEGESERLEQTLQSMGDIDFSRTYTDKSDWFKALDDPSPEMTEVLHQEMGKGTEADKKNCGACGYYSCDAMAKAILNGLYRPQQCHHFLESHYEQTAG